MIAEQSDMSFSPTNDSLCDGLPIVGSYDANTTVTLTIPAISDSHDTVRLIVSVIFMDNWDNRDDIVRITLTSTGEDFTISVGDKVIQ